MFVALLRMNMGSSKQYDQELDYFIINSLAHMPMGYKDLFRLVKVKYNPHIVDDTFSRHLRRLVESGMIKKDATYSPYYLTEKCRQQLKLGLVLEPPKPKKSEPPPFSLLAIKRIQMYILILLFKPDITYEFAKIEDLENFLSLFSLSLSIKSFVFKSAGSDTLYRTNSGEVYRREVKLESIDGRFSVDRIRYQSHSQRQRNSISFVCYIKGIKYPITRFQSDPFSSMEITQDEIKNVLSVLTDENILQKPIVYSGEWIYLVTDIHLYNLLSEYSFLYCICRATLNELWNLREPAPEEIEWLRGIVNDSEVEKCIINSFEYRKKSGLSNYKRQKRITDLIKRINKTERELTLGKKEYREWNEKKYQHWMQKEYDEIHKVDIKNLLLKNGSKKNMKLHYLIRNINLLLAK